jgi:heterodisulfide reductase subunit A2
VNNDVLVIGGGIAGMQSALLLAEKNHHVFLLEKDTSVGGFFPLLDRTYPTNSCGVCFLSPKPPAYCPIYESDFHENIEIITNGELTGFSGVAGSFTAELVVHPRYVDADRCTLCGRCRDVCPVVVKKKLGDGLEQGKAIDLPFAQAIPRTYSIDDQACTRCGDCLPVCDPRAIDLDQKPKERIVNVGAVVLGCGFEAFPGEQKGEYGLGRYRNVVSSIQFERMLSFSAPGGGFPSRPSDEEAPGRIAFIQCVGSRDSSCGQSYCSSICCMYATKQAMVSKDRSRELDAAVFYMDIRPMGKDHERYYQRAADEYGVRYLRSAVSSVREIHRSGNLLISYITGDGRLTEEEFDLVVLSVGVLPPAGIATYSELIGFELNEHGFCRTDEYAPTETTVPGVYAAGAVRGPKDIPETVVDGSSAAADVSAFLGDPDQNTAPAGEPPLAAPEDGEEKGARIGVFICEGRSGSELVLDGIETQVQNDPDIAVSGRIGHALSPAQSAEEIVVYIERNRLDRVLLVGYRVVAMQRALRERVESLRLDPLVIRRANIGEQCLDVHMEFSDGMTEKASSLVAAGLRAVKHTAGAERRSRKLRRETLVVGGGLAGMTSSLSLADQGIPVTLVEKEARLGGNCLSSFYTLRGADVQARIGELVSKTESHPNIDVRKSSVLVSLDGTWGSYRSKITTPNGELELEHGAAIFAVGGSEIEPDEYLYGEHADVITQRTLEHMIAAEEGRIADLHTVVMIQCAGARSERRPYCSRVCCGQAVKNALQLKRRNPDIRIYVLDRDIRTFGFYEDNYREAREAGVIFIHYEPLEKPSVEVDSDRLRIAFKDHLVGERLSVPADLLVLSAGIEPNEDVRSLAEMAGVETNPDGFFQEANAKAAPLDSVRRGIYFCGLCHSPSFQEEAIGQAKAAAARASALLWSGAEELSATRAFVNERRCSACGLCVSTCPYSARDIDEYKNTARVDGDLCAGCGNCAAVCPNGASQQYEFESTTVLEIADAVIG